MINPKGVAFGLATILWTVSAVDAGPETPSQNVPSGARQETTQEPKTPPTGPILEVPEKVSVPELVIAGHVVIRLRSRAGGLTSTERAYNLRQRLGPILTLPNLSAEDVVVRQRRSGQTASIYVRKRLLITVDRNLARANDSSIEGLAFHWARNLRQALPLVNVTVRMSGNFPVSDAPAVPANP